MSEKKEHITIQEAAQELTNRVHAYMAAHPQSELHTCGKMFGVLTVHDESTDSELYLSAFSAQLDGTYLHEGFVPPVYLPTAMPIGTSRSDSQRLQRLFFAQYRFTNGLGETRNLTDIFADEKPILSPEEWFNKGDRSEQKVDKLPPSGAGECCAPKLLQYALTHHMKPIALAEFWIGAPSGSELRREGCFYPPCAGKCKPILRHMLKGVNGLEIKGLRETGDGERVTGYGECDGGQQTRRYAVRSGQIGRSVFGGYTECTATRHHPLPCSPSGPGHQRTVGARQNTRCVQDVASLLPATRYTQTLRSVGETGGRGDG